jgi:hypothetical protein
LGTNQGAKAPDTALRAFPSPGGLLLPMFQQREVRVVSAQAVMCRRICCICRPQAGWTEHSACARQETSS